MNNKPINLDTTTGSVNPADPTGNLALTRVGGKSKGVDENEWRDSDRDKLDRADVNRSNSARAIARRQSMPNGEWAIRNAQELRQAIQKFLNPPSQDALSSTYGSMEIQRHIIQRARDLQMSGTLPGTWGVAMEDNAIKLMLDGIDVVNDNELLMTTDQLTQANRFFSARQRRKYASQGTALPDGSFPIPDKDALRRAIRSVGRSGSFARAKRHILKRAKALGATAMLPEKWATAEDNIIIPKTLAIESHGEKIVTAESLQSILVLDGSENAPLPLILEDSTTETGGFARIKVPFYVGDSISKAPGFTEKILFPTGLLQSVILEAKAQIKAARQPLTIYPRHKTALDGSDLPIGGIVDLVQEGRVGYIIADIVNKGKGEQAIALMKHKDRDGSPQPLLNAVSLRSGPGRFEMERVDLEDASILKVVKLLLDGVDFAPDSPAMKTYGIEFLAAETVPTSSQPKKEDSRNLDLTLEALRSNYRSLIEEIEAPFHDEIARLSQEISNQEIRIKGYEDRERRHALAEYVQSLIDRLPESKRIDGGKVLQELAATCSSREDFTTKAFPIILDALDTERRPVETAEDKLRKLFPSVGGSGAVNGATVVAETVPAESDSNNSGRESIGPLEVPATPGVN